MTQTENIRFKQGDRLTVHGPATFPLTLEVEVLSNTAPDHSRMPALITRLHAIGSPESRVALILLEHWRDTDQFSISVRRTDGWHIINELDVTVEPHAHPLSAYVQPTRNRRAA